MNELPKALYDTFYEKQPAASLKAEVEKCHQKLIERLGKPERRLVLQIIDCKDQIAGFSLAMRLSQELNIYDEGRPTRPVWSEEDAL